MIQRIVLVVLAGLSLGACCCGPVTVEQRRHAVRVEGVYYLLVHEAAMPAQGGPVLGAEHTRVARQITCDGIVLREGIMDDPCGFQDGDSDVLAAGATLHPVDGAPAGQRLGAVQDGRFLLFHPYYPPD